MWIFWLVFSIANAYGAFTAESKFFKVSHLLVAILCMVNLVGELT